MLKCLKCFGAITYVTLTAPTAAAREREINSVILFTFQCSDVTLTMKQTSRNLVTGIGQNKSCCLYDLPIHFQVFNTLKS